MNSNRKVAVVLVFVVVSAFALTVLPGMANTSYAAGTPDISWYGSTDTDFLIDTADELAGLATLVNSGIDFNSKTVTLAADIDMSAMYSGGSGWEPIGNLSNPFNGTFDGGNHIIKSLTITTTGNYVGLFGYVGADSIVKDLGIEGGSVKGGTYVGSIVGYNNGGTVSNCYSACAISGSTTIGDAGAIGLNAGMVENCYNTGAISGGWSGGLVGHNEGTVLNCYNAGEINGTVGVGGVVGRNESSCVVSDCYNTGTFSGTEGVGGVVGQNGGTVLNCYNVGAAKDNSNVGIFGGGSDSVGGVSGLNTGMVSNCYNAGAVALKYGGCVGGVTGTNTGTVSNCYNTGNISGMADGIGGVIGNNQGTVSNCYNTGGVSGKYTVGGVVGLNSIVSDTYTVIGTVTNCFYNKDNCSCGGIQGADVLGSASGLTKDQMTADDVLDTDGAMSQLGTAFEKRPAKSDGTVYYPELAVFKNSTSSAAQESSRESTIATTMTDTGGNSLLVYILVIVVVVICILVLYWVLQNRKKKQHS